MELKEGKLYRCFVNDGKHTLCTYTNGGFVSWSNNLLKWEPEIFKKIEPIHTFSDIVELCKEKGLIVSINSSGEIIVTNKKNDWFGDGFENVESFLKHFEL